jgi:hypothetical protein
MGVDYIIGYGCVPKEVFTSRGLLERAKAGERVKTITEFYQLHGDERKPEEMGFEFVYRNSEGEQETQLVQLDELIRRRAELDEYEHHCDGCPANRSGKPFGCMGTINYPISQQAEVWMLEQLPGPEYPLPFLLLKQGPELGNTGQRAEGLRDEHPGVFFESATTLLRSFPEMNVTGEQLFELLFLLGDIQPKRAVMILLFLGGVTRQLEADELMGMTPAVPDAAEKYPFVLKHGINDDDSTHDLIEFAKALHMAFLLDRDVLLDV